MDNSFDFYMDLVVDNPVQFGIECGFDDLENIHNEWIKSFLFAEEDETLLAHRGSYKTTCLSIAIAIMLVLYPDVTIIFMRKTDTDVTEIVLQVQKLLLSDIFQDFAHALWGKPVELLKETNTEIDTNLKSTSKGTSQLLAMGIGASITGKHGDIIITDDIVNLKDRVSRAERERTKTQYQELQNVKNRGGRFINTGTPWHKEDAISMMPNVVRHTCYDTGLIDKEQLKHLREVMTPSLFAANYELKHIVETDSMFTTPNYTDETKLIYNGKAHIDAAYGGSDYTAYTVAKKQDDGSFIMYGKLFHKHVDDCMNEIVALHKHLQAGTVSVETNGDKGYLAKELRGHGLPVNKYHEKQNKYIKIATHLRANWQSIRWLDDTDPEYISQVLDYTENAEHDDAPDSAASLIRRMKENEGWIL
ncbi:hypothetical protein [Lactococcus garvieae]|uniref:hypothetical protein n=1 Tax=Lactococcus garvieae TaxID=1363 RepID=UPI003852667D